MVPTTTVGTAGNQTLGSIGTYTGFRYVVVRSVKSSIEDPTLNMITIEYAAGVVVGLRPCIAAAGENIYVEARTLSIPVRVYVSPFLEYPASVEMYVYPIDGSIGAASATTEMPDNNANAASVVINAFVLNEDGDKIYNEDGEPIVIDGIQVTVDADGYYYYQVGTTAASGATTINPTVYGPVYLTNETFEDPTYTVYTT
jgi:hypothetical protein